jgi:hypothetical protein
MSKARDKDEVIDDMLARHKVDIAKNGFSLQAVIGDASTPPYVYTIGLSQTFSHPEIFLVGMHPQEAAALIVDAISLIKQGKRFDKPVFVADIIPGFEIPFRPIAEDSVMDHGATGLEILGPFDAVQMFYPDPEGHVPWEKECMSQYKGQLFFEVEGDIPVRNITLEQARAMVPKASPLTKEQIAENRRKIIEQKRQEVSEHGFVPQVVGGTGDQPGFLYTIGLTETWSHPEIYIMALHPEQAFDIILDFVERISQGERFDRPAYVEDILTVPLAVRPIGQDSVDANSGIAQDILGRPINAVQAYWPDQEGLMPWEEGCDPGAASAQLAIFTPEGEEPVRSQPPPGASIH